MSDSQPDNQNVERALAAKLESLLFIANRPLTTKRLAELVEASKDAVEEAVAALAAAYVADGRGFRLVRSGGEVQMTTAPDQAQLIQDFLRDETTGELTKPSLETLTIIAYRGPLTKPEMEQIRGVNCSLIIRNLLMRGLIEIEGDPQDLLAKYRVTIDFLRFLGVSSVEELPDYDRLRSHENIVKALEKFNQPPAAAETPADEAPPAEAEGPAVSDEIAGDSLN